MPAMLEPCPLGASGRTATWGAAVRSCGGVVTRMARSSGTPTPSLPQISQDWWMRSCRFIHMVFHRQAERWFMYDGVKCVERYSHLLLLISSNLVDDEATNCVTVCEFNVMVGSGWTALASRKGRPSGLGHSETTAGGKSGRPRPEEVRNHVEVRTSSLEDRGSRLSGLRGPSSSPRLDAARKTGAFGPREGSGDRF